MTDLSLNERAALAAGWMAAPANHTWKRPDGFHNNLPDCEHSFDAAYAMLWPLVDAEGFDGFEWYGDSNFLILYSKDKSVPAVGTHGSAIAAAFTIACLEVLGEKP